MAGEVYFGSATSDAAANRGWLLGHFMPGGDVRHSADVEVKWGVHPRGDMRAQWVTGEARTALILLVSGRFRVDFPGRSVLLSNQGDYVVFDRVDQLLAGRGEFDRGRHQVAVRPRIRGAGRPAECGVPPASGPACARAARLKARA